MANQNSLLFSPCIQRGRRQDKPERNLVTGHWSRCCVLESGASRFGDFEQAAR